jgi:hypothetical protein
MFATELMKSTVEKIRPLGLPSKEDLAKMTPAELAEVAGQQTRIIIAFLGQTSNTLNPLRARIDQLEAKLQQTPPAQPSRASQRSAVPLRLRVLPWPGLPQVVKLSPAGPRAGARPAPSKPGALMARGGRK